MKVITNDGFATASEALVRTHASSKWVAADNDMNAVYVLKPGANRFVPVVQALWKSKTKLRPILPGVVVVSTAASRAYLPWIVDLADGGALLSCKFGCKEPVLAGILLNTLDWGSCLVCFNADGSVRWSGRYNAHKGNAQVVVDPGVPDRALLVAATGIVWTIQLSDGKVIAKQTVPIGETGEKSTVSLQVRAGKPGIVTLSFVGYTGHPAALLRYGLDDRAIPVAAKPPYEMGADEIYCRTIAPWGRPKAIWWAAVLNGCLRYNYVGPKSAAAKWGLTNLPASSEAVCEPRHAPSLFQIPGDPTRVGAVFHVPKGGVVAKSLNRDDAVSIGDGGFAFARPSAEGLAEALYWKGAELRRALISE